MAHHHSSRHRRETAPRSEIYELSAAARPPLRHHEHLDRADERRFLRTRHSETAVGSAFPRARSYETALGGRDTGLSEMDINALVEDLRAGRNTAARNRIGPSHPRPILEASSESSSSETAPHTESTVLQNLESNGSPRAHRHVLRSRYRMAKIRVILALGTLYFFYTVNWNFLERTYVDMPGPSSRKYLSKIIYDASAIFSQILISMLVASLPQVRCAVVLTSLMILSGATIMAFDRTSPEFLWYTSKTFFGGVLGTFQGAIPGILVYLTASWSSRSWRGHKTMLVLLYLFPIGGHIVSAGLRTGLYNTNKQTFRDYVLTVGGVIAIVCAFVSLLFRVDFPDRANFLSSDERAFILRKKSPRRRHRSSTHMYETVRPSFITIWELAGSMRCWSIVLMSFMNGANWPPIVAYPEYSKIDLGRDIGSVLLCAVILLLFAIMASDNAKTYQYFLFPLGVASILGFTLLYWPHPFPNEGAGPDISFNMLYQGCSFTAHVIIVTCGMKTVAGQSAKQNVMSMLLFIAPRLNRIVTWSIRRPKTVPAGSYSPVEVYQGVNLILFAAFALVTWGCYVFSEATSMRYSRAS